MSDNKVTMYGAEWCGDCRRSKKFLDSNQVNYTYVDVEHDQVGWPVNLPESGPFWTNRSNDSDFSEIMNFLNHCSQGDWDYFVAKFRPQLMDYDPYNIKLVSTLNNLLYDNFIK